MKKNLLLAIVILTTAFPLNAQERIELGSRKVEGDIELTNYKQGDYYYRTYKFADGDYFTQQLGTSATSINQQIPAIIGIMNPFRMTRKNSVIETNEEGINIAQYDNGVIAKVEVAGQLSIWSGYRSSDYLVYKDGVKIKELSPSNIGIYSIEKDGKTYFSSKRKDRATCYDGFYCLKSDSLMIDYYFDKETGQLNARRQTFMQTKKRTEIKDIKVTYRDPQAEYIHEHGYDIVPIKGFFAENKDVSSRLEYIVALLMCNKAQFLGYDRALTKKEIKKTDVNALVDRTAFMCDSINDSWSKIEPIRDTTFVTCVDTAYITFPVSDNELISSYEILTEFLGGNYGDMLNVVYMITYVNGNEAIIRIPYYCNSSSNDYKTRYDDPTFRELTVIEGVYVKNNGKLIFSDKEMLFEFNNGDKFIPDGGCEGFFDSENKKVDMEDLICSLEILPREGILVRADGTTSAVLDGLTQEEKLAMEEAAKKEEEKKSEADINELKKTYGEKWVNTYLKGEFQIGMPGELAIVLLQSRGFLVKHGTSWSDGTTRLDIYESNMFERKYRGYMYLKDNKLSSWSWK